MRDGGMPLLLAMRVNSGEAGAPGDKQASEKKWSDMEEKRK